MKGELAQMFQTYVHWCGLFAEQWDISELAAEFRENQAYALREIVGPLFFQRTHVPDLLGILVFPIPSTNVERAFPMFHVIIKKEQAALTNSNIAEHACICYNKL